MGRPAAPRARAGGPGSPSSVRGTPSGGGIVMPRRGTRVALPEAGSAEKRPGKSGRRERVGFGGSAPTRSASVVAGAPAGARAGRVRGECSNFRRAGRRRRAAPGASGSGSGGMLQPRAARLLRAAGRRRAVRRLRGRRVPPRRGRGILGRAAAENAVSVTGNAVSARGKPASVPAGRGSRSRANEEPRGRGRAASGKNPAEPGIAHSPARAGRPRASGKPERSRGEPRRGLPIFVAASRGIAAKAPPGGGDARAGGPSCAAGPRDPAKGLADRYGNGRPRVPLGWSERETPARARARKMPPPDAVARGAG